MMTAEPLPSPADVFPDFKIAWNCDPPRLDWRERDGIPFLHRGMYFDSFEHAMQHDRWRCGFGGLRTKAELAEIEEAKRLEFVSRHQPWEES